MYNEKKYLMIWLVFFSFIAFHCKRAETVNYQERIIGCITPLTGSDGNYGKSTKQGLDLAAEDVNKDLAKRNKPYRYKIIYEDDQMSPTQGPSAYHKLTTVDKVPLILGPFGSKVVLAVAPIAEKDGRVLITASATADEIADAGDFIFRTVPSNRQQAKDCANFALSELNAKNACILYVNDAYGITLKSAFEDFFLSGGGKILSEDAYEGHATDFRAQLTLIRSKKPNFVFIPGYYKEPASILKQAYDLGLQEKGIKFVGTDGSCTDDLIRIAGATAEGSYFSNLAVDFGSKDSTMQGYLSSFRAKYNSDPDAYTSYYYDAFKMLARVFDSVQWDLSNPEATARAIKDALYSMPAYDGITGVTKFDSKGEVSKPFAMMLVHDGKFIVSLQ